MKNRDKILLSATKLFNENGFVNVRLQHISDATIISVGNIAYHFKNKEAIVSTIFEELEKRQKEALIEYRHTPIFANIDRIFFSLEALQNQYSFFFTDIIEIKRSYPALFEKIKQFFHWQVFLFQEIIRFNVSRGALRDMFEEEGIQFLAMLIIQQINAWKAQTLTWKDDSPEKVMNLSTFIWKILIPYMTKIGLEEYQILIRQKVSLVNRDEEL